MIPSGQDRVRAAAAATDRAGALKSERSIMEERITAGLTAMERPTAGLFLSGLSGGLDIGFSLFLMAVMLSLVNDQLPPSITRVLVANMYAIGFIFVILGRSELFTEQTALAVLPVLDRRAGLGDLGRLWSVVYISNLLGTAAFALLATIVGPALGVIELAAFGEIARPLVRYEWWVILASGALAGWLMGLVGWLVAASRDTISQLVVVWLVTTAIGFSQLHHSIVGSVEMLAGLFSGQGITLADYGYFLVLTTLGNIVGGVFFFALIKYGHVTRRGEELEPINLDVPVPVTAEREPRVRGG